MMKQATDRFLCLVFYSDLHGVRFTLAIAELLWAITLLWVGTTFDRPTYLIMSHVMPENAWGLVFLFSGMTQLSILYKGDFHSRFATYFAAWNFTLWLYVVWAMYGSVSPPPAAISGEAALAFAAGWVWVRSGYVIQGRRSDDYGVRQTRRQETKEENVT